MNTSHTFALLALLLAPVVSTAQTTNTTSTTVIVNGDTTVTNETTTVTRSRRSGVTINLSRNRASRAAQRFSKDFGIYLGVNNYSGSAPAGFDVRPGASRFVALSWRRNILLTNPAVSGKTKLQLGIGPEIAWNNFVLDGNLRFTNDNDPFSSAKPQGIRVVADSRDLKKSKLTVCQFNVPVVLNIAFKSGLTLGVGAYAGIRLDSYTKVKPEGGDPTRDHGPYALNNVRWGLTTELGWRNEARLFVRYEPSNLFRDGQGPNLNAWAVGVRL